MKKAFKLLPLFLVVSLTACTNEVVRESSLFCFDTVVTMKVKVKRGKAGKQVIKELEKRCQLIDKLSDPYNKRDTFGIYDLNQTNEKVLVSDDLYDLLSYAKEAQKSAPFFNPLIGSLSEKWKEALDKNEVLSDAVIQEELEKINNSELILEPAEEGGLVQRVGEAKIDLGAIAKGYALDLCQSYLKYEYFQNETGNYIVNAGSSSILLGLNDYQQDTLKGPGHNNYTIKIKDLSNPTTFRASRSIVSTSGISEQKKVIDGVTYSHIINPSTGSAVSLYDAVVVVNRYEYGNGAIGDALSTSLMMTPLEDIKEAEKNLGFNVIVIKDDNILYMSDSLSNY